MATDDHALDLGARRWKASTSRPRFAPFIMPMAAVILAVLFLVQRVGTAKIGRAFGPVMLVWFL